ncbi:hypothetical protein KXR87_23230 [Yokenella regensburgei]|uniref:hypothetical protein n=1 Tax=Yokenella regensburgei TaxID=158877 RepID=UPI003F164B0D
MSLAILSNNEPHKIRGLFNIQQAYCAIKTNDVTGFSNRKSAWRGQGGGISSTNAMMLMENGENEISLEIGALGWFSDEQLSQEERGHFDPHSACSLELVRFNGQEKQTLSSIKVTINTQGLPEAQPDSSRTITREKVLAEHYSEMAIIINSRDRNRLKAYDKTALIAWSATTGDSEDEILLSQYNKDKLEGGEAKILPIKWEDYEVRIMNKGRMVQFYNKSKPNYSPLTYKYIDEDGDEAMNYYAPIFSLIDGKFIPVI